MGHRQKELNFLESQIEFINRQWTETTKRVAISDEEFARLSDIDQAACQSGYGGLRFRSVPVTDDDREALSRELAAFEEQLRTLRLKPR